MTPAPLTTLTGGCHCGNISIAMQTHHALDQFTPRLCQCSFCRQHGAAHISDPDATLAIHYQNPNNIRLYHTEGQTLDYVFCRNCGVMTHTLCIIDDHCYAVVNSRCLLNYDFPKGLKMHLDALTPQEKIERRTQFWIKNVVFSSVPSPQRGEGMNSKIINTPED